MDEHEIDDKKSAVPFTARLIAYYRALESRREDPLIVDPFAEKLAGDMRSYFRNHRRARGTNDYAVVRAFYIDERLLKPWCEKHKESQVVLLGAGLDARAYRFEPLGENSHTVFELDFELVNRYKADVLKNDTPLCSLKRVSGNLSESTWISDLEAVGFSQNIPTFWLLEGLVYYLDQNMVVSILKTAAKNSADESQVFADVSVPGLTLAQFGPFMMHFKWGLNIEDVPAFFAHSGWSATCTYADDFDQGRDVGQRNLIFVVGKRDLSKLGATIVLSSEPESATVSESELKSLSRNLLEKIMPEIDEIVKSYSSNPDEGKTRYLTLIDGIRPTLKKIIRGHNNLLSIGHISSRLLRDPSTVVFQSEEEEEAHIVGYLSAIFLLMYCIIKGLDGWQFNDSALYQESLKIGGNIGALLPFLHQVETEIREN